MNLGKNMRPLTGNNLFTLLLKAVDSKKNEPFFYYQEKAVSFGEGLDRVQKLANYLRKNGVEKNDRVILLLPNIPEFIYAHMAIAQLGAISVLINPVSKRYELKYITDITKPSFIITESSQLENFTCDGKQFIEPDKIVLVDNDSTGKQVSTIIEEENAYTEYESLEPAETVSIIFTAATDGNPAGAELTHTGIWVTLYELGDHLVPEELNLSVLPFFHSYGLATTYLLLLHGMNPFIIASKLDPGWLVKLIQEKKVTKLDGVPLVYKYFNMFIPTGTRFPSLRIAICGGDTLSIALIHELKKNFDIDIRQGYGLTEASPIVTWNHIAIGNKIGSVGSVMNWNEVKIISDGKEVGADKDGEILVRGANVIHKFYKDEKKTREAIIDGWLHTGDIGHLDSDGYLYITGRIKDMIIRGGLNVYPKEVERIIGYHPQVDKVSVTQLHLRDSPTPKDSIRAEVYTNTSALDKRTLKEWCVENLSLYKMPKILIK